MSVIRAFDASQLESGSHYDTPLGEVVYLGRQHAYDLRGRFLRSGDYFWMLGSMKKLEKRPRLDLVTAPLHLQLDQPQIGTDPEFFVGAKGGSQVPAFAVLPSKVEAKNWFWDGYQAETRVHPDRCLELLADNLKSAISLLPETLELLPGSIWEIPKDLLQVATDSEVALGCDPSLNAYGMSGQKVEVPRDLPVRFAGGHVHFGFNKSDEYHTEKWYQDTVKAIDAFAGIASVALAANYDNRIRRQYYGLAGEYRLPQHGLEYRTLSNFWLMHPLAMHLMLGLARHGYRIGAAGLRKALIGTDAEVSGIINSCDVKSARELMKLNHEIYDAYHDVAYGGTTKRFWEAINNGIDKVIPNFGKDVRATWQNTVLGHTHQPKWGNFARGIA